MTLHENIGNVQNAFPLRTLMTFSIMHGSCGPSWERWADIPSIFILIWGHKSGKEKGRISLQIERLFLFERPPAKAGRKPNRKMAFLAIIEVTTGLDR